MKPYAFISYRRVDSSAAARWIAAIIKKTYGADSVFIDTESIRMADNWRNKIQEALEQASLLICVIGPRWLSASDQHHKRRIDNPNDWVQSEIKYAINNNIKLLPVLLSQTPLPETDALPDAIQRLTERQAVELRDEHWNRDLDNLLEQLGNFGFTRATDEPVIYPTPMVTLREYSPAELDERLERLKYWRCVTSDLPGSTNKQRTELHRKYEFSSFRDAISFMSSAVNDITAMEHHPRWENVWRTVSVWLTTWDIGHKPSKLDFLLADKLDHLRLEFPSS